jgi:hypothetical protein
VAIGAGDEDRDGIDKVPEDQADDHVMLMLEGQDDVRQGEAAASMFIDAAKDHRWVGDGAG